MIRVAIAEDHPEMRLVLRLLLRLSTDIDLVGEAVNGREAVDCVKLFQPAVLVMDVRMPVLNGWEATQQIVDLDLGTNVILISADVGAYMAARAAKVGAKGFLRKDDVATTLRKAISAVAHGETFFMK